MNYYEFEFNITPYSPEQSEILTAYVGQLDFESFVDTENGFMAYIAEKDWNDSVEASLNETIKQLPFTVNYKYKIIEGQNWNALWESNFEPISIGTQCLVKAPFHNITDTFDYTIVIEPKMSFGTGHHETTFLMLNAMLNIDFTGKEVLDMGCGTGILAILASMRGAKNVTAIDIEDWAYENAIENAQRNNCSNIGIFLGNADLIENKKFDIIIANINRNVLLEDISKYKKSLQPNGLLLMSGFYFEDIEMIKQEAEKNSLTYKEYNQKNKWVMTEFRK
jgi:ribosomal protein L11 methyltransferase